MPSENKAKLLFRQKSLLRNGMLRDGVVWWVPKDDRYPDGYRYRLALVEHLNGKVMILFDNHYPKGHHVHLKDGREVPYEFKSLKKLLEDYEEVILKEEK